jgi:hypothetical protein
MRERHLSDVHGLWVGVGLNWIAGLACRLLGVRERGLGLERVGATFGTKQQAESDDADGSRMK